MIRCDEREISKYERWFIRTYMYVNFYVMKLYIYLSITK